MFSFSVLEFQNCIPGFPRYGSGYPFYYPPISLRLAFCLSCLESGDSVLFIYLYLLLFCPCLLLSLSLFLSLSLSLSLFLSLSHSLALCSVCLCVYLASRLVTSCYLPICDYRCLSLSTFSRSIFIVLSLYPSLHLRPLHSVFVCW